MAKIGETKRIQFLAMERPRIEYVDREYIPYSNVTSLRHNRKDQFYYVNIHMMLAVPFGNNVTMHFYFYEWLTNQYKRGFIEMHLPACILIHKNKFFGTALRGYFPSTCPIPVGDYHLYNMTVPVDQIPRGFPFTKGRIYCNITIDNNNKLIGSAHIDIELKTISI
ncbi:uncharacterized protein LOC131851340 [Achroia grisella]|uniref:uncharacterized protein LOC131851340 n=1 Tax=Achroia grisella TaxID=688607 RepID=UPI0027D34318|nr:uncharacterized protein LOC131851340 [Achroia grisella]